MSHAGRGVLAGLLSMLAASAWTQDAVQSSSGGALPEASSEALSQGLSPTAFVMHATTSGLAEVELGKLAIRKAASDEVRQFAQTMVREHEQNNAELNSLATAKKLTVASEPDAEQRGVLQHLTTLSGRAFDAAYIDHMLREHAKAVALFQQATQLEDRELAAFASKTLPTLQNHRQMVGILDDRHGGTASSQDAALPGSDGTR